MTFSLTNSIILFFTFTFFLSPLQLQAKHAPTLSQSLQEKVNKYKTQITSKIYIVVDTDLQKLFLMNGEKVFRKWPISSSKFGLGSTPNSNKTPTGLHYIHTKVGDKVPLGGILKARQYIGRQAKIYTDKTDTPKDHVTTRLLWLKGLERNKNLGRGCDSYQRYIYIHGTPEEGLIGQPASMGCIRMKNKDVIQLYKMAREGVRVLII